MIVESNPTAPVYPSDYWDDDEDSIPNNPYSDEDEKDMFLDNAGDPVVSTPSQFVEFAIYMPIKGGLQPFSFNNRRYLRAIYDTPAKRKLIMAGRQVEKSTYLGNSCLAYAVMNPFFRVLYVSPSNQQTKVFSRDRIKEPSEISPVLKHTTNSKMLANVLEKKFVNLSQITLRFAFLNADRCIAGDSVVQLATGELVPIRELVGRSSFYVISSTSGEKVIPCATHAKYARSKGVQEVVKLTTDYPVPIKLTADHQVLTHRGWIAAEELEYGDYIMAPHSQGQMMRGEPIGKDTAWVLGAMASEGECSDKKSARFTNSDEEFFLEFRQRADRLGVSLGKTVVDDRYDDPCFCVSLYADTMGSGIDGAKKRLWELGEWGKKSVDKTIPTVVMKAPLEEKAEFLQALFRGDGWCCEENGFARAGYSTSSRIMAEQLCHLLWSLGIRTSLRTKAPSTDNAVESYVIDFSTNDTFKLVSLIGEYRPGLEYRSSPGKSIKDRIPVSYGWLRHYIKDTYGLSTHAAWKEYRIQLRPGNRKDSIGRRVLTSIADKLNDGTLQKMASPDVSWVEVMDVEPLGKEEVFDLSVPATEAFVANGLVVHNCRGIPADKVLIDEFQDILLDNVPVIEECASHSDWKIFCYSGTPKSLDNSIEHYWSRFSTQNEWMVPCKHHGTPKKPWTWHWNILREDNIGDTCLICDKCGKQISPLDPDCQWMALNPKPNVEKPFEGYRIPQLMVPWIDFSDIKHKQRAYSRAKFYNEVLGRSYDSGTRPLTRRDIQRNCWEDLSMQFYRDVIKWVTQYPVFMGVDWGTGEGSYTVVTLGGYLPFKKDRFTYFYFKRFEGLESEPKYQLKEIIQLAKDFNVHHIGVDYGGGHWPNDELVRVFGAEKVKKYQWVGNVKRKITFDSKLGVPRFLCHRTEVMSDMFNAIKRANVFYYPRWEEFEDPFAMDFLNIYSEYNDRLRMNTYKHAPSSPDDSFHSATYCFLVSFFSKLRPDVILPTKEIDRHEDEDDHIGPED